LSIASPPEENFCLGLNNSFSCMSITGVPSCLVTPPNPLGIFNFFIFMAALPIPLTFSTVKFFPKVF